MEIIDLIMQARNEGIIFKFTKNDSIKVVSSKIDVAESWIPKLRVHKEKIHEYLKGQVVNFVSSCCFEFDIEPIEVINCLLSIEDETDIINDQLPKDCLKLHIEVWIKDGKPFYSGKILDKDLS